MLPINFIVRLFITLFTYCIIYNLQYISIIFIIFLLIFLDWLDGSNPFIKYKEYPDYHMYDKINDSISYLLLLPLVYKLVSKKIFRLLMLTTFYRLLGVITYSITKNKEFFIVFPDLFKELLLVEFISNNYTFINMYKIETIIATIFLKLNFEYLHHKTSYTQKIQYINNLF